MQKFLTVKQVCELLGIERTTLYRWRKQGLPSFKTPTGLVRFEEDKVLEWIKN